MEHAEPEFRGLRDRLAGRLVHPALVFEKRLDGETEQLDEDQPEQRTGNSDRDALAQDSVAAK